MDYRLCAQCANRKWKTVLEWYSPWHCAAYELPILLMVVSECKNFEQMGFTREEARIICIELEKAHEPKKENKGLL